MHIQRMALVLGQHDDAPLATVHEVGQRKINQPVMASERDGRLGPIAGERHESPALAAGEDHR
jgi:hypothetical protein